MSFLGPLTGMVEGGLLGNISGLTPAINGQAMAGNFGAIPKALAPSLPPSTMIGGPGGIVGSGLTSQNPQLQNIMMALAHL